jgi:hypothetical protein
LEGWCENIVDGGIPPYSFNDHFVRDFMSLDDGVAFTINAAKARVTQQHDKVEESGLNQWIKRILRTWVREKKKRILRRLRSERVNVPKKKLGSVVFPFICVTHCSDKADLENASLPQPSSTR